MPRRARWFGRSRLTFQAVPRDGSEGESDGGAGADAALGLDAATVCLDEVLDDRQPESGTALGARAGGIGTVEALEEAWKVRGFDPRPGIPA